MGIKQQYKSGSVGIFVDYSYDVHDIKFSGRTYKRIHDGKPLTIRGQGFFNEEETVQDYWVFNQARPNNDPVNGSIYVYCDDGRDLYLGHLDDGEVYIDYSGLPTAAKEQVWVVGGYVMKASLGGQQIGDLASIDIDRYNVVNTITQEEFDQLMKEYFDKHGCYPDT
jgi:hypothetical protein